MVYLDKVLTTLLLISFGRAQNRIAKQRIDSRMELGRVVDIRKKVFSEVKVRVCFSPVIIGLL